MADRVNTNWANRREKEPERFYLFAGMGGRAARAKHKRILQRSIVDGTLVSVALAAILYLFNRLGR